MVSSCEGLWDAHKTDNLLMFQFNDQIHNENGEPVTPASHVNGALSWLVVPDHLAPELCLPLVEEQLYPLDCEVGVVLNGLGKEQCRVQGSVSGVSFTPDQRAMALNGYVTHNHPNGFFFSLPDLRFAHVYNVAQIRAVARTKTDIGVSGLVHILDRPATGWDLKSYQNLRTFAENELLHECEATNVPEALWTDEQRQHVKVGIYYLLPHMLVSVMNIPLSTLTLYGKGQAAPEAN